MDTKATDKHIVKSFDDELKALNNVIAEMGGLAEAQLNKAVEALSRRSPEQAVEVIESDRRIDALEHDVGVMTVRMLALRQPMAKDLREVVAAIKIASDIERIGDYAKNIAKRAIILTQATPMRPAASIPRMAALAQQIVKQVLDAYIDKDPVRAHAAWRRDEEVDEMLPACFRLSPTVEDRATSVLDPPAVHRQEHPAHRQSATNIAEIVYFMVEGRRLDESRPKGDTTNVGIDE
jgi:phosphate transport system protein